MTDIQILLFDKKYQEDINALMADIQKEFAEIFTAPQSKTITELSGITGESYWVALHQNKVIGTVGLSLHDARTAILRRLFVAKEFRGKTFQSSQKLLETAINKAKELGVSEIVLGTMAQFEAAQGFYIKNHFTPITKAELPANVKMSTVDCLFFRLGLNSSPQKFENYKHS